MRSKSRFEFTAFSLLICWLLLASCQSLPPAEQSHETPQAQESLPQPKDSNLPLELPKLEKGEKVITHNGFRFVFDQRSHLARWVAYRLTPEQIRSKVASRRDNFQFDAEVKGSPNPKDYEASGYDRGHLAPAEDMRWSKECEDDSFFMTNMTPQKPKFNRGLWKKLETKVRKWAESYDETFVVSGPVLDGNA